MSNTRRKMSIRLSICNLADEVERTQPGFQRMEPEGQAEADYVTPRDSTARTIYEVVFCFIIRTGRQEGLTSATTPRGPPHVSRDDFFVLPY